MQSTESKEELIKRIAHFLETDKKSKTKKFPIVKKIVSNFHFENKVEANSICSEIRKFFLEHIGKLFSFNIKFQQ